MQSPWASACVCLMRMKIRAAYHQTFFLTSDREIGHRSAEAVFDFAKNKRPPIRAAYVFLRNNYGFFGVAAGVAGCCAGVAAGCVPVAGLAGAALLGVSRL